MDKQSVVSPYNGILPSHSKDLVMLQHKSTLKTILNEGITTRIVLPDEQEVKTVRSRGL